MHIVAVVYHLDLVVESAMVSGSEAGMPPHTEVFCPYREVLFRPREQKGFASPTCSEFPFHYPNYQI